MNLEDYREQIGKHLDYIEAGAAMTARHANMMVQKPAFETLALDEIDRAERVLTSALAKVQQAKVTYAGKAVEHSNAA